MTEKTSTKARKVIFLLPSSVGERLAEDGVISQLTSGGLEAEVWWFHSCTRKSANRFMQQLIRAKPDAVLYPDFQSEIFFWERASQAWFFGWKDGEPILSEPDTPSRIGIAETLDQLEEQGIRTFAIQMRYGGPFDDEISLYPPGHTCKLITQLIFAS
jgi:hypothetical protein